MLNLFSNCTSVKLNIIPKQTINSINNNWSMLYEYTIVDDVKSANNILKNINILYKNHALIRAAILNDSFNVFVLLLNEYIEYDFCLHYINYYIEKYGSYRIKKHYFGL